jgi:Mce-associated membrane protein
VSRSSTVDAGAAAGAAAAAGEGHTRSSRRGGIPLPAMDTERQPPAARRGGRGLWLRVATVGTAVLAVLAVLAAAWYGIAWFRAANSAEQSTATLREEVLRDARTVILNLEAISYQTLDADLARWEDSVTGPLLEDFRASRERYAEQVLKTQAKAEASIVEAAVVELNPTAGTADVLVFVNLVTTEHKDGQETGRAEKRQRLKLEMTRTDDGWKASQAGPVGARS